MITRYAIFEGQIPAQQRTRFEREIVDRLLPAVRAIPGIQSAVASFARDRDPGAAEILMFLVTTYRDRASVEAALSSPQRRVAQATTEAIFAALPGYRISHHVTETLS